jgi:chemotaxis protein CheX
VGARELIAAAAGWLGEGSFMDVRFINPFVAATKTVFTTMVATDINIGKPYIIRAHQEQSADVSAVIGMSGDAVGCVVLSLPMQTACNVASKFAGTPLNQSHPDFSDALGELANMVAGQAKAKFEALNVSISLPSVIVGQEHVVSQSRAKPRLALPCHSDLGDFTVEVVLVIEHGAATVNVAVGAGA